MRSVVAGAAALLAAAGCGGAAASPPALATHPCVLAGTVHAVCGRLLVRENPRASGGRRIAIGFAVVPATSRPVRPDPLLFLAGGPGDSAVGLAAKVAGTFTAFNRHHDLLLVDQRGTGVSTPLVCPAGTIAGFAAVRRCVHDLPGDPRFYTTPVAMDDVDRVRSALGYRRLDVWGGSYGGTAAQVYVVRHPRHVRAALIESGSRLGVPILERYAPNAQAALDALLGRCAATPSCRAAFPRVRSELGGLLARLRRHPAHVDLHGGRVAVTADTAASTLASMLDRPDQAAEIPITIHRAFAQRDYRALAAGTATPALVSVRNAMPWAIRCNEIEERYHPAATARRARGTFLAGASTAVARLQSAVCRLLPRPAPEAPGAAEPVRVPILFMNGALDPKDPPANIRGVRGMFPDAATITVPFGGHGVLTSPCTVGIATAFLARASAPGVPLACLRTLRPPPFVLP